jgi:hypothetical protein
VGADFRDLSPSEQLTVMKSEARVALVIGNGAYQNAPLANAQRDAGTVAKALQNLGFEVTFHRNLSQRATQRALVEFGDALDAGGVGLFYYAGHGIQHEGENYLVPTDAVLSRPDDLEVYGVEASAVLAKMEGAGNRLNIVILDACRNDPFTRGHGGLAMMDARGTFLAYASGAGRVATDEGTYARALVRHMATPGAGLWHVFERVGADVESATGGAQSPWVGSNARGEFYFVLPDAELATTGAHEPQPVAQSVWGAPATLAPSAAPAVSSSSLALAGHPIHRLTPGQYAIGETVVTSSDLRAVLERDSVSAAYMQSSLLQRNLGLGSVGLSVLSLALVYPLAGAGNAGVSQVTAILGGVSAVGSIPFFVMSKKRKDKAIQAYNDGLRR